MFAKTTRILVADDMMTMRILMKNTLVQMGFESVQEAVDGKNAWELVEKSIRVNQPIQLVFSDWNMPNVDGCELLSRVRKHPKVKNIPFIMVTARGDKNARLEAHEHLVSGYVSKPFSIEKLKKTLTAVFKETQLAKALDKVNI